MAKAPIAKPAEKQIAKSKGDSMAGLLFVLMLLSPVAGGSGFLLSSQLIQSAPSKATEANVETAPEEAGHAKGEAAHGAEKPKDKPLPAGQIIPLAPIITNIAQPADTYLRMEGSILADPEYPEPEVLKLKFSEDIIALLRTKTLQQLQGSSGLSHLREDINDRLRIRSEGKAAEFIISSLVVE